VFADLTEHMSTSCNPSEMTSKMGRYLLYFAHDLVEFRKPEMRSILKMFDIKLEVPSEEPEKPFWIVNLPESDVRKIASRSVSLRYVVQIWSHSNNLADFHEGIKAATPEILKSFAPDKSFKIVVETFNKHFTQQEKVAKIESLSVPFIGPIDLKNPQTRCIYFEHFGLDTVNIPPQAEEVVFGLWLCDGQREMINSISLKTRKFLGNTSMQPSLSLLMANQGLCGRNQLMYDPFAGTGSMLIGAAKFGSYTCGSDIDFKMLHGKTKPIRFSQRMRDNDESIKANFKQYGLETLYLDIFVGDFSNCPLRENLRFDSILTDRE